jgi:hypothetical protein
VTRKRLLGVLVFVGLFALIHVAAWGQAGNGEAIKLNGGRNVISVTAPSQPITPAVRQSPGLVTIYSNLGKGGKVYNQNAGVGVLGNDAGQMLPEMVGTAFRPKADHVVTEIQVGATHVQGTNVLVVSLNQDNKGVPGKVLHTWHFSNLPVFGSCCTLQTAKYAKGIPVKKGKLYWVVLRPQVKFQDTYDVWDDNYAEKQGTWANNTGTGWNASYQALGSLGVFGK